MRLGDLFNRKEALIGIDIGSSAIKLVELDITQGKPRLINVAVSPFQDKWELFQKLSNFFEWSSSYVQVLVRFPRPDCHGKPGVCIGGFHSAGTS